MDTNSFLENWQRLCLILTGFKVAVVGGAANADIDSAERCDIVVRINNHAARQGGRADIIVTGGEEVQPKPHTMFVLYNQDHCQHFLPGLQEFPCKLIPFSTERHMCCERAVAEYHTQWLQTFMWELNTIPFTGILAVKLMTLFPIRSLFVTGFNFYEKDGSLPYLIQPHHVEPQAKWLAELAHNDKRVELAPEVQRVLPTLRRQIEVVGCREENGIHWRDDANPSPSVLCGHSVQDTCQWPGTVRGVQSEAAKRT